MPVAVNLKLQGHADMVAAVKKLQAFLGQTVNADLTMTHLPVAIIALQTYLQTQGKFSSGSINSRIDDQQLPAKIIELQVAANLP